MRLPKKDKQGRPYLSYSQIAMFKRSRQQYLETYIFNKPFETNAWVEFGAKVGTALQENEFKNFSLREEKILRQITRLDIFEKRIKYDLGEFYIIGNIDTASQDLKKLVEYKTGGKDKELQYLEPQYIQPQIYALGIEQETGSAPDSVTLEFIRRTGNPYSMQPLKVAPEEPIIIDCDISPEALTWTKNYILQTAAEIEEFYINKTK